MPEREQRLTLTVTQLNEYIRALLDGDPRLGRITVKGEISNFTLHRTGHLYFTLKDDGGVIRAVMFRSAAAKLKFVPEDGMKVFAGGRVSVFPASGQYQLYIDTLEPDGVGALFIAYEQLRKKLEAEGLFREDRKKPLPKIPKSVGVITSPTGAAVRDIKNVTGRRFPYAEVILYPALVQGDGAPEQLIAGLEYFAKRHPVDVIIIGRGGGSIEDLWAFNDERLARAIAACPIPTISAVGHETDFTIADFVADRRAPTPSAAAELAVPETAELKRKIGNVVGRIETLLRASFSLDRQRLESLARFPIFSSPLRITDEPRMKLLHLSQRLDSLTEMKIRGCRADFSRCTAKLEALDPMAVLTRGYSAVFTPEGKLVKKITEVTVGDRVTFRAADGEADCTVEKIRRKNRNKKKQTGEAGEENG